MAITLDQIIQDAQRVANRFKDLEALGNALLVEAEGNNRQIETMKQFQDDIDSLNKLARNKTNAEMVNRVNQQNSSLREFRQENRELKATLEDHQRALELIMHKYREQIQHKVFTSRINFKEIYNANLQDVIRRQQEKINEMAAVMQKAASFDDDINNEIELITRLKVENQGLREILQISKQFGTSRIGCEDKSVQTEFLSNNLDINKIKNDDNDNNKSMNEKNHEEILTENQKQYEKSETIENELIRNPMKTTITETVTKTVPSLTSLSSSPLPTLLPLTVTKTVTVGTSTTTQTAAVTTTTMTTAATIVPSSPALLNTDDNKSKINLENEPKKLPSMTTTSATTVAAETESISSIEEPINLIKTSPSPPPPSSSLSEMNSIPMMNGENGDCKSQEQVS